MRYLGILTRRDGYRTPLGRWLWQRRFSLSMSWWRFWKNADYLWCRLGVLLHLRNPQACRGCGRTDLDGYDPTGQDTWCEAHCPDHDYQSDSMRSGKWCVHCGAPEPW